MINQQILRFFPLLLIGEFCMFSCIQLAKTLSVCMCGRGGCDRRAKIKFFFFSATDPQISQYFNLLKGNGIYFLLLITLLLAVMSVTCIF